MISFTGTANSSSCTETVNIFVSECNSGAIDNKI